jgi:hypothetical protein
MRSKRYPEEFKIEVVKITHISLLRKIFWKRVSPRNASMKTPNYQERESEASTKYRQQGRRIQRGRKINAVGPGYGILGPSRVSCASLRTLNFFLVAGHITAIIILI